MITRVNLFGNNWLPILEFYIFHVMFTLIPFDSLDLPNKMISSMSIYFISTKRNKMKSVKRALSFLCTVVHHEYVCGLVIEVIYL
jgi:hypothetical protein